MIRTVVDDCLKEYRYDPIMGKRISKGTNPCKEYVPTDKEWFNQSRSMIDGQSQWTDPRAVQNGVFGMTLVTRLNIDGIEFVFLAVITAETLDSVVSVPNLPDGAVAFVVTPREAVISATNGDLVIQNATEEGESAEVIIDGADWQTTKTLEHVHNAAQELQDNPHSIDVASYIYKGTEDNLKICAFSFYMMYVDFFNGTNIAIQDRNLAEVGFIVISYDETYLDKIYIAFYVSWGILGFMLFTSCLIVCFNVKSDEQTQKNMVSINSMGVRAAAMGK